jgi:hypothetical protein
MALGLATSLAGQALGMGLGIFGAIAQARQEKANAEMQAQAEDYNAKMEDNYAKKLDEASKENSMRNRKKINAVQGEAIASMGKAGIAVASGSPLAVMAENQVRMETEAHDQQVHEYQEAMKHREQAKVHRYQAAVYRASGNAAMNGITGNILGSVANGFSSIGNSIMTFNSFNK